MIAFWAVTGWITAIAFFVAGHFARRDFLRVRDELRIAREANQALVREREQIEVEIGEVHS